MSNLKTTTLRGHLNVVYDMDWFDEQTLVSVSSDRTGIVWFLTPDAYTMRILPHPSFLYAVKCLQISSRHVWVATGGRDSILRFWKVHRGDDSKRLYELNAELDSHQNYITAITCTRKFNRIYSSDWDGVIVEWSKTSQSGCAYEFSR